VWRFESSPGHHLSVKHKVPGFYDNASKFMLNF